MHVNPIKCFHVNTYVKFANLSNLADYFLNVELQIVTLDLSTKRRFTTSEFKKFKNELSRYC